MDLRSAIPPDDTGTDTFRRYLYQAEIAFRFCLQCVCSTAIRSVIMEHFEDIVVEYEDHWLFIQVKSRDPQRGPWRLSDVLGSGGGLSALARTYQHLPPIDARFALYLEGPIAARDPLNHLAGNGTGDHEELIGKISTRIDLDRESCSTFLRSVRVNANQPTRELVGAHNQQTIGSVAPHATQKQIIDSYEKCLFLIHTAMAAERLGSDIAVCLAPIDTTAQEIRHRFEAKRLNRERLREILSIVTSGNFPLLRRIVDSSESYPTELERKLLAAGATERLVQTAAMLRANAYRHRVQLLSSTVFPDIEEYIEDVDNRLLVYQNSSVSKRQELGRHANDIWSEMLDFLTNNAAVVDPNRIFGQDPMHLQGCLCQLADECKTDWGF